MTEGPLPIYTPLTIVRTFGTGANQPVLMRGVTRHGEKEDIVVKLMASERMDPGRSMRELVAAMLARRIGLNVPEPCLTIIDEGAVSLGKTESMRERLQDSLGINFSCVHVKNLFPWAVADELPTRMRGNALKVFVFDLLIQNVDRTKGAGGKPNLFTVEGEFYVLDHELSFSFLDMLIPSSTPWRFTQHDIGHFIRNHVLYGSLKRKNLDFSALENMLEPLDDSFWSEIQLLLPSDWPAAQADKIKQHINSVKLNFVLFLKQIKQILS